MREPLPLPDALCDTSLTRAVLEGAGLHPDRLRRQDIRSISHGIHTAEIMWQGLSEPQALRRRAQLLVESLPECWISHATAAQLRGLWVPRRIDSDPRIHLSQPLGTTRRIRRKGVVGHRCSPGHGDVVDLGPRASDKHASISSPARNWFELATECSEEELVILGDCLVRRPRPRYEGRSLPWCEGEDLHAIIERTRRVAGRPRAQRAVQRIRVGSDSPQETRLRLRLIEAGLPEPDLQVPALPWDRFSPHADLGYPEFRVAVQYDGETHFSPEQARLDQWRDNAFISEGWVLLRFNLADHRDGFRAAVRQVRRALLRRGWRAG